MLTMMSSMTSPSALNLCPPLSPDSIVQSWASNLRSEIQTSEERPYTTVVASLAIDWLVGRMGRPYREAAPMLMVADECSKNMTRGPKLELAPCRDLIIRALRRTIRDVMGCRTLYGGSITWQDRHFAYLFKSGECS